MFECARKLIIRLYIEVESVFPRKILENDGKLTVQRYPSICANCNVVNAGDELLGRGICSDGEITCGLDTAEDPSGRSVR